VFDYFFQQVASIRDETELLEACQWDEDRKNKVKEIYLSTISEIVSSKHVFKSIDEIKFQIRETLSKSLSESEINILENSLSREISSFQFGDIKNEEN
tara:strand:- start:262 stop:555 length:294 start_codon:yes stop_codon:yes gene_type:complete